MNLLIGLLVVAAVILYALYETTTIFESISQALTGDSEKKAEMPQNPGKGGEAN